MKEIKFSELANFQSKQQEAAHTLFSDQCRYLLYGGAAGGGKSYFLRWAALGLVLYYTIKYNMRGVSIGLFSEDYPTLKDRQITKIKKEFPSWLGELKDTKSEGYAFKLRDEYGGGMILLRNLDDPSKYASVEFAAILVEELTKNKKETFDDLRFRMRYPGIEQNDIKFVAATNPGQIGHGWVKKLWVSPDPADYDIEQDKFKFVSAHVEDNSYIDAGYRIQLEALPERKRKALLEGNWDIFEGQYFTEFNKNIHTCRPFSPKKEFIRVGGLDWGSAAPFACLISAVQVVQLPDGRKFHRVWTFQEFYGTDKHPEEWGRIMSKNTELNDIKWIYCDNQIFGDEKSRSKNIYKQFIDADERYRTIMKKATKDRVGGWQNMHKWLSIAPDGLPYWIITESCPNLIRTLPELIHDELKVEDVNTKGEDHAPDAARYMFSNLQWIDAKVGGTAKKQPKRNVPVMRRATRRVSLDSFATAKAKTKRDWKTI